METRRILTNQVLLQNSSEKLNELGLPCQYVTQSFQINHFKYSHLVTKSDKYVLATYADHIVLPCLEYLLISL